MPYSEGLGVKVRTTTTEELEERVGTQVGVSDEKILDEISCTGFNTKTKRTTIIPNNINPPNRNREYFILPSSYHYA